MPTRFWEMAAGCLIYLMIDSNKLEFLRETKKDLPSFLLLGIICTFFIPIKYGLYSTILIVFLSSIFLSSINIKSFSYGIITSRISIFIGLISYSLYLWHWGIISLSKWLGFHSSGFNMILIVLIISLISIGSYFLIEKRFRNINLKKLEIFIFGFCSIFLTTLIIPNTKLIFSNYEIKYRGLKLFDLNFKNEIYKTEVKRENCHTPSDLDIAFEKCRAISKNSDSLIIMTGDSMSDSLLPLASMFHWNDKHDIIEISQSGVFSPQINFSKISKRYNSNKKQLLAQEDYINKTLEYVKKNNYKNKYIWIFNDLNYYFYGRKSKNKNVKFYDKEGKYIKHEIAFFKWISKLEDLIKESKRSDINIIYFGSLPSISNGSEVFCAKMAYSKIKEKSSICLDNVIRRRSSINSKKTYLNYEIIIRNLQNIYDNFKYFDTSKFICEDLSSCKVYKKNFMYLGDSVHLSNRAAKNLYPFIKQKMDSFE